jgi:hypothetical protein
MPCASSGPLQQVDYKGRVQFDFPLIIQCVSIHAVDAMAKRTETIDGEVGVI